MAIQPTPPIQLDPSIDRGHELAFINQNFNNIASVIGQNSFVIVLSGTTTLTVPNPVPASTTYTTTIAHNLGIVPASICFVNLPSSIAITLPGQNTPLPYYNVANGGGTTTTTAFMILTRVDSTNLYIDWKSNYAVALSDVNGIYTYKYYLLQQTTN